METKACRQCGKEFKYYLSQEKRSERKFCSFECRNESYRRPVYKKCETCGDSFRTINAELRKGGGRFCSKECLYKSENWAKKQSEIKLANPNRFWLGKIRPEISGEKNYNWRGGVTPVRNSKEYVAWQKSCVRRDNYRCFDCGEVKKGQMQVDHVYPFGLFARLRFEIENGETVCKDCHLVRTANTQREVKRGLFMGRPLIEYGIIK